MVAYLLISKVWIVGVWTNLSILNVQQPVSQEYQYPMQPQAQQPGKVVEQEQQLSWTTQEG